LLDLLKEKKEAIGWTLGDIKRISYTMVYHKIYLEDGTRPYRDRLRRLNPTLQEILRKKLLKWLTISSSTLFLIVSELVPFNFF